MGKTNAELPSLSGLAGLALKPSRIKIIICHIQAVGNVTNRIINNFINLQANENSEVKLHVKIQLDGIIGIFTTQFLQPKRYRVEWVGTKSLCIEITAHLYVVFRSQHIV